jgi:hypothetical protein
MAAYKKVPFKSGSRGLDSLVSRAQKYPGTVTTRAKTGSPPRPNILNGCLDLVDRISALSPKSPGGDSIPQALTIVYGVYSWLQRDSMSKNIASAQPGVISLDSAFSKSGDI